MPQLTQYTEKLEYFGYNVDNSTRSRIPTGKSNSQLNIKRHKRNNLSGYYNIIFPVLFYFAAKYRAYSQLLVFYEHCIVLFVQVFFFPNTFILRTIFIEVSYIS